MNKNRQRPMFKKSARIAKPNRPSIQARVNAEWNRKIPPGQVGPIVWGCLRSIQYDLAPYLRDDAFQALSQVIEAKSFFDYVKWGATYCPPQKHTDAVVYLATNVVSSAFKKIGRAMDNNFDQAGEALKRLFIAEMRCKNANKRILHYRQFDHDSSRPLPKRLRLHEVFHLARRKIASWLGPVDLEEVYSLTRFGPGGVVGLKRPKTTPYYKLGNPQQSCTSGAFYHALRATMSKDAVVRQVLIQDKGYTWDTWEGAPYIERLKALDARMVVVESNEVTFVPKDAKTHRSIAIEPAHNVELQLAVGTILKRKLKRVGTDLSDQSRNQQLAKFGSMTTGPLSPVTLDAEMASDCLCIELVRELLPGDWFDLLSDLRSPYGKLGKGEGGTKIRWEKFSSMGNGYTFELESLIFLALAQSISDLNGTTYHCSNAFGEKYYSLNVFGDDMVVPKEIAPWLIDVLRYVGFRINEEKSFTAGPFRESCGEDYWHGLRVRPFLFKRELTKVGDLLHLHNGLTSLSDYGIELPVALAFIRGLLPQTLERNLRGWEFTMGDEYLRVSPEECRLSKLVTMSESFQRYLLPRITHRAIDFSEKKSRGWRYCQLLYVRTGEGQAENIREEALKAALQGDASVVVKSGHTRTVVDVYSGDIP